MKDRPGFFKIQVKEKEQIEKPSKSISLLDRNRFGGIGKIDNEICQKSEILFKELESLSLEDKIETINRIKQLLHSNSPFKNEPVDCVVWVRSENIKANDYNPNVVAPPEMKLLEHSIDCDGYTQPIVAWSKEENFEVVDGFHRNRVGKECSNIKERIFGYLPLSIINAERENKNDRIASTIRHNRARGKHTVDGMKDIVIELRKRNWTNDRIGKELGMEPDEVLRLCQINGLLEMFGNVDFSQAWESEIFDDEEIYGNVLEDSESE